MPRTPINNTEYNNYIKFMLFLNGNRGYCSAIDPEYFDFVSSIKVFPENLARTVLLATPIFKQHGIYILHQNLHLSKRKNNNRLPWILFVRQKLSTTASEKRNKKNAGQKRRLFICLQMRHTWLVVCWGQAMTC